MFRLFGNSNQGTVRLTYCIFFAAAKVATICQNGLIGGGGISLAAIIYFKNDLSDVQLFLCIATLMIISFASNIFYAVLTISAYMLTILISVCPFFQATILVIEKDWVAVIAHREKGKLARKLVGSGNTR